MPLSETEKQALKEKYKEQRRAMWAGEHAAFHHSNKTPEKEESDAQSEPTIPARHKTTDVAPPNDITTDSQITPSPSSPRFSASTPSAQSLPDNPTQGGNIADTAARPDNTSPSPVTGTQLSRAEVTREAFCHLRETTKQEKSQVQSNRGAEVQAHSSNLTQAFETVENLSQSRLASLSKDNPPTSEETTLMREKIRKQREETWEGQSSIHSRRRRQHRRVSKGEREFWEGSEKEEGPKVLTWKLTLGVVGTIILLIGIGFLLGYWLIG